MATRGQVWMRLGKAEVHIPETEVEEEALDAGAMNCRVAIKVRGAKVACLEL